MQTLCIVGLGYIGLPTAVMFAQAGYTIIGVDANPKVIETLNSGSVHVAEPALPELFAAHKDKMVFQSTATPADAFIIAVPTPINKLQKADLTFVENAIKAITRPSAACLSALEPQ